MMAFIGFMLFAAALLGFGFWSGANWARKYFRKNPEMIHPRYYQKKS